MDKEWKSTVLWENKHKLCKMTKMTNGNLIGNFNNMFRLSIEKFVNKQTGEETLSAYLVPVKHEKNEEAF